MVIHTFHARSSLHFTALRYSSLTIFYVPALFDVSSPRFKIPSPLLTYTYFPSRLSKNVWFTGESRQRLCRRLIPQSDLPIHTSIYRCLFFVSWPQFYDCDHPCSGSAVLLSPIDFLTSCLVHALNRAQFLATFLRCAKVSQPESFVWFRD